MANEKSDKATSEAARNLNLDNLERALGEAKKPEIGSGDLVIVPRQNFDSLVEMAEYGLRYLRLGEQVDTKVARFEKASEGIGRAAAGEIVSISSKDLQVDL